MPQYALSRASARPDTRDYLRLFLDDLPLLDVRAPVEFARGAFPAAVNLPLLDDDQRELIGKRYKEAGQDAAIALGGELATEDLRQERVAAWRSFCRAHPQGYLYCFRGGLRSSITQRWLREAELDYPRVLGGYKALRGFLLASFEELVAQLPMLLLSGPTGAGKTRLLRELPGHVDLEGLARHRGSAFGATLAAQPAQIDWENAVAIALLKHRHRQPAGRPLLLEDEGRLIGRVWLPLFLQQAMAGAGLVVLERDRESRARNILRDYVEAPWRDYRRAFGEQAAPRFSAHVLGNLGRIRKRLGGERHERIAAGFRVALELLAREDRAEAFLPGIHELLAGYYDPMYEWQLQRRRGRVRFRGDEAALRGWLRQAPAPGMPVDGV